VRPEREIKPLIGPPREVELGTMIRRDRLNAMREGIETMIEEIRRWPKDFVYLSDRLWMLKKFRSSVYSSEFKLDATWWTAREKATLGEMINEFMQNRKRKGYGTGPNRAQVRTPGVAPASGEARPGHNPAVEQNAV
jgi:hypothetical protein